MSTLLQRMLAEKGRSVTDFNAQSRTGQLMRRVGVQHTPELDRIIALPTNERDEAEVAELQEGITSVFKTDDGEQEVWPIQAMALADLHDHRGLLAGLAVGAGKTLITYLAPLLLGSERPLLLIPAHLRGKTKHDFEKLAKHWKRHHNLRILSYTQVSRVGGDKLLAEINPDLIIADECHALKNPRASVTRKVGAWMRNNPETVFCGLSGTITKRSIMDYWHLLLWALGSEAMPLPAVRNEAEVWSKALDEKVQSLTRFSPGALGLLHPDKPKSPTLQHAREGYGLRLQTAPGVIITKSSGCGVPIYIDTFTPKLSSDIMDALDELLSRATLPNGDEVVEPAELWRRTREITLGFYNVWDPEPPIEWMMARKAWKAFARECLEDERLGLFSEEEVRLACEHGLLSSGGRHEAWSEIKGTFKPNAVPRWIDTSTIQQILLALPEEPCVIWAERTAVGEMLSELGGFAYFRQKGYDKAGRLIDEVNGKETVVASVSSNSEGHNLQGWSRSFVTCPMPQGAVWEQLLGRHDREGQSADEINVQLLMTPDLLPGMRQAVADARYQQTTTGSPQKLLFAQATNAAYDFL